MCDITYEVQFCKRLPDGSLVVIACDDDPDLAHLVAKRMLLCKRRWRREVLPMSEEEFDEYLQEEGGDE